MSFKPLKLRYAKSKVALMMALCFAMPAAALADDISHDDDYYADEKAFYEANGLEWTDQTTEKDENTDIEDISNSSISSDKSKFEVQNLDAWFYDKKTDSNVKKVVTTLGMYSNGEVLEADVPAMVINGTTLVPIRFVGDLLGATIGWDNATKEALFQSEDKTITLEVGSATANVNGEAVKLSTGVSVELVVYDGIARTLVPLRFVSEQLGATVNYDEITHTVDIIPSMSEIPDVDENLDTNNENSDNENSDNKDENVDKDVNNDNDADTDKDDFVFDPNVSWAEWILTDPAKVIIDPGHGGKDPGAIFYNTYEGDINWSIAEKFAELLDDAGIEYAFTRDEDEYVLLAERAAVTKAEHGTVFVSIHCNSSTSSSVTGLETYGGVMADEPKPDINGEIYNFIQADRGFDFAKIMQENLITNTGAKNRGAKQECYIVLNQNPAPGVLIETGFMSNKSEFDKLVSDDYQYKLAQGLVDGVTAYFDHLGINY